MGVRGGEGGCREGLSRLAALMWVSAMALGLLLGVAPAATAGGLTSVLVVSPASGETASLYYSDRRYGVLERLLGTPGEGRAAKPPEADLVRSRQINVTWLAHDISPVRVDRIHLGSKSPDVWIHTSATPPEWNGTWHRSLQPDVLRTLLDELGVMGQDVDPEQAGTVPAAGDDTRWENGPTAKAAGRRTTGAGTAPWSDGSGWWWTLPGLGAGIALGYGGALLIRRAAARHESGPPREEPRQELIDL
ncbi:hypothetical protein [Streptomyces sp. NPDC093094]|uniref:hypothetical protein n=1 Tax=Streptomyces sp. NPDC093094 TaxID=3366026 RepID=UPI00381EB4AF